MGHDPSLDTRGAYFVFRNMVGFTRLKGVHGGWVALSPRNQEI